MYGIDPAGTSHEQFSRGLQIAALGELDVFVLLQTVTRTLSAKQTLIDLRVDETDAATSLRYILGPDTRQDPTPTEAHTGNIDAGGTQ